MIYNIVKICKDIISRALDGNSKCGIEIMPASSNKTWRQALKLKTRQTSSNSRACQVSWGNSDPCTMVHYGALWCTSIMTWQANWQIGRPLGCWRPVGCWEPSGAGCAWSYPCTRRCQSLPCGISETRLKQVPSKSSKTFMMSWSVATVWLDLIG